MKTHFYPHFHSKQTFLFLSFLLLPCNQSLLPFSLLLFRYIKHQHLSSSISIHSPIQNSVSYHFIISVSRFRNVFDSIFIINITSISMFKLLFIWFIYNHFSPIVALFISQFAQLYILIVLSRSFAYFTFFNFNVHVHSRIYTVIIAELVEFFFQIHLINRF